MTNRLQLTIACLILVVAGWAMTLPARADAMGVPTIPGADPGVPEVPQDCAEDDPCFNCRTMGNRICGNDRWVRFIDHGDIFQVGPRIAAATFHSRPGEICLVAIKGRWGHIRRPALCN